jgi:hypothetical protein
LHELRWTSLAIWQLSSEWLRNGKRLLEGLLSLTASKEI